MRRIAHPRKTYHDPTLTAGQRTYRIRLYRAQLRQWFADMDAKRERTGVRSAREARFCTAFTLGVCALMARGKKITRAQLDALGAAALDDAGYRLPRPHKAHELLELPRVQSRIAEIFADKGVDVTKAADVLLRCMNDGDNNVTALAATELFFRVTTGFAVTKSANLHKHERADKFFDDASFANPPKPVIATTQER